MQLPPVGFERWILELHVSKLVLIVATPCPRLRRHPILVAGISEHFPGSPVSCRASDVLRRDLISGRLLVGVEVRAQERCDGTRPGTLRT